MQSYWNRIWEGVDLAKYAQYINPGHEYTFQRFFKEYRVKKVCDAACGFGKYSVICAKNGLEVSGFDLTQNSIELAKKMLDYYGLEGHEYKVCSITEIAFPDSVFDGVIAHAVMDHLTPIDAQKALGELKRVTRPGGLVYISFDGLSEEDQTLPHDILPDGGFLYTGGRMEGMYFRYYLDEEIKEFLKNEEILFFSQQENGDREIIINV